MDNTRLRLWRQWRGSKRLFQFKFFFFFFLTGVSVCMLAGAGFFRASGLEPAAAAGAFLVMSLSGGLVLGGGSFAVFRILVRRLAEGPVQNLETGRSGAVSRLLQKLEFAELVARLPVLEEEHRIQVLNSRREARLNAAVLADWLPERVAEAQADSPAPKGKRCCDGTVSAVLLCIQGGREAFTAAAPETGYAEWSKILNKVRQFAASRGMLVYRFTPEYSLLLEGSALGGKPCNPAETERAATGWCRDVQKLLRRSRRTPQTAALLLKEEAVLGRLDSGRGPLYLEGPLLDQCAAFLRLQPGNGVWVGGGWPEKKNSRKKQQRFETPVNPSSVPDA